MRSFWTPLILGIFLALGTRAALALDPGIAGGVGGIGRGAHVTSGAGRSSEDGLAHPGFPSRTGAGQIGVPASSVVSGTNPVTSEGFHAAGMGKVITAGIGRSTMESVPGRSQTYLHIVAGTRSAPVMGGRSP